MTSEIRSAIDLHLRQGQYPKAKTLADYLVSKGIACSPQEAFDHMKEYQDKGMLKGNPELVELLKNKKTKPENLVDKVASDRQIPMSFDPRPFATIPGAPKVTKSVAKTIPEVVQTPMQVEELPPIGDRPVEQPRKTRKFSVKKALDFMLDGGALIIALVVDIVMNVIGWGIIAYDTWTRIAFIAMGIVIVLFALRAWVKGGWMGKSLWLGFALIATFLDISVSVASSHQQSLVTVYDASKDDVLIALKTKEKNDADYLEALRAKQVEKGEGYKGQIDNAVAQANKSSEAVRAYRPQLDVGLGTAAISSSDIFTAIPDAIGSKDLARIIGLILYSLAFALLQLVIVTSATNSMTKLQQSEKKSD